MRTHNGTPNIPLMDDDADEILDRVASVGSRVGKPSRPKPVPTAVDCPLCGHHVAVPSLEIIIDVYRIPPQEAAILSAVWRGKGLPVSSERIFDAMYADDINGGPSPSRMYAAFKGALFHLRERLEGSGVSVENAGYRRGFKLTIGGAHA